MANDLTTPLTGRKRRSGARPHLPIARALFAVLVLIAIGFVLRLVLGDGRRGGHPAMDPARSAARNGLRAPHRVAGGPVPGAPHPRHFPAGSSVAAVRGTGVGAGSMAGFPNRKSTC